jgi:6-pyruvoyltetrahydropterin/6-carboxytetrahydropterin synthase
MFELEKIFTFEAGHALIHHDGKCKEPHGHSYICKIRIRSNDLVALGPKKNMVVDFSDISKIVKPMVEKYLDHQWLNKTLDTDSPTAEFIAQWIYEYLKPHISNLYEVVLFETPTSSVTYRKD